MGEYANCRRYSNIALGWAVSPRQAWRGWDDDRRTWETETTAAGSGRLRLLPPFLKGKPSISIHFLLGGSLRSPEISLEEKKPKRNPQMKIIPVPCLEDNYAYLYESACVACLPYSFSD